MKKLSTTKQNLAIALALAAFGTALTAPAFAGTSAAGPSSRNIRPHLQSSTNDSSHRGYSAYAMVPTNSSDTVWTSLGQADRFGAGSQS